MKTKLQLSLFLLTLNLIFHSNSNGQKIAAEEFHNLAVCGDGTVMAWGRNWYGQLGDSTTINKTIPVKVHGLNKVIAVACGAHISVALKSDGTVWSWGWNYYGNQGFITIPIQQDIQDVIAIASGGDHVLCLKNDGTVWSWGGNYSGQLGVGSPNYSYSPIKVVGLKDVVKVTAGLGSSYALKKDGTVWAWGSNDDGQLGDGTYINSNSPIKVKTISNIIEISSGSYHCLALKDNGTVWAWGYNSSGQIGDGTYGSDNNKYIPVQVSNLTDIGAIAAGRGYSIGIKKNGTVWGWGGNYYGLFANSNLNMELLPIRLFNYPSTKTLIAGKYHNMCLKDDGTLFSCGRNDYGQLGDGTTINKNYLVQVINLCSINPNGYAHNIIGALYNDQNNDCIKQTNEMGLSLPVIATPVNYYAVSNDTGYYSLGVNDSINYIITPIIPQRFSSWIKNPCPANYNVYLDASDPVDTSGFDFGFEYNPCHQLRIDVSSNRRRRCFRNNTRVFYTNEGLASVGGVEVKVKVPQYVVPLSASMSYTLSSDSNMVFNIGTLNANQSGYITITDSVACVPGITGLTQCTKAWITPANTCLIDSTTGSGWDKSSVKVEGECVNDTVRFIIYNTGDPGTGDMAGPSEYRIYADNALMQTVSFQLAGGDSLIVTVVSGGATIRLEADQRPGHPGNSKPRETVERCGTSSTGVFSIGMVTLAPQDDEDIDIEMDCLQIIDSYDPNDKQVSPAGIGPNKIILPQTPLDYMIRFQNTGTDTAYKVVVVDTLSQHLDLSTLELGASSFPYTFKLSGAGKPVLTFTFNNINLTDTFTNEAGSHGFVKFKIAPYDTVAIGTQVANHADIFFDYNFPVRTNTAQIKIDTLVYTPDYLVKINTQPTVNSFYCSGDSVTISASFSGTGATYQWYKNNQAIPGKSDSILTITSAALADSGYYYAKVTGHLNSLTTDTVKLDVRAVTKVSSPLNDVSVCEGTAGSLTASAEGSNLTYQWYKDGLSISGATGNNLLLDSLTFSDTTSYYYYTVTGDCGTSSSDTASIKVKKITAILSSGSAISACEGTASNGFSVTAEGSNLLYRWYKDEAAINGATLSGISFNSLALADSGDYYAIVTGDCGTENSDTLTLTVIPATKITSALNDVLVCEGTTGITLNASATGSNISYEWYKDGAIITNETASQLNLDTLTLSDNGVYYIVVAGDCGTSSDTAAIAVTDIEQPTLLNQGPTLIVDNTFETYQWINCGSNTIIPGANDQSYTATENGNYAVIVTQSACTDTSACVYVTTVGVGKVNQHEEFKIYPNPTSGIFTLEMESNSQVIIYNIFSEIVYEASLQKGKQEININHLANGVYMLKAAGEKEVRAVRIVKQ